MKRRLEQLRGWMERDNQHMRNLRDRWRLRVRKHLATGDADGLTKWAQRGIDIGLYAPTSGVKDVRFSIVRFWFRFDGISKDGWHVWVMKSGWSSALWPTRREDRKVG